MANQTQTPQEFVRNLFSPLVAVMCSPTVDTVVGKNNLSFVELLQPFTEIQSEVIVRDPGGSPFMLKTITLLIKDVNSKPAPPHISRKLLNDVVSKEYCEDTTTIEISSKSVKIPSKTPWFDHWRSIYFDSLYPLEHDFISYFISCMLITTSREDACGALAASVRTLATLQSPESHTQLPKFFNSNVLRTYVLLHDLMDGPPDKAERMFESMKQTYGAGNCFMLCINSLSEPNESLADIWTPIIGRKSESEASALRTPVDMSSGGTQTSDIDAARLDSCEEVSTHPLTPSATFDAAFDSANTLQESPLSDSTWCDNVSLTDFAGKRGTHLDQKDRDNIATFLKHYGFNALLPYIERQIAHLTEAVANRKGVSRSLLSATKRWFGPKPGSGTSPNTIIYTADCPEMQQRRLGDAWFLLGAWQRAFAHYHAAKRDLLADGATSHYASTLTMAALSAAMLGDSANTTRYFQQAHSTLLNTCRMVEAAVRVTLLAAATIGQKGEAAGYLIRMTSEDADLRSALLLEQAALCFVPGVGGPTLIRKYAFHMVLAGHRYSKAGHKNHAYRCYSHALEIYGSSWWRCAGEHVSAALGRLALATKRPANASLHLARTLTPKSPHPASHHAALLREYLLARQQEDSLRDDRNTLLELPIPTLMSQQTEVFCAGPTAVQKPTFVYPTPANTSLSAKLEEYALLAAEKPNAVFARPTITCFTNNTDNTQRPSVPQGEPVRFTVTFENPIKVQIKLTNVQLLWNFISTVGQHTVDNEVSVINGTSVSSSVVSQPLQSVLIDSEASVALNITLTPLSAGDLTIKGIAYKLQYITETGDDSELSIFGKQLFSMRGPRLNKTKDFPKDQFAADRRLEIKVTEPAPCLQLSLSETDEFACVDEIRVLNLEFLNAGPEGLSRLSLALSDPSSLALWSETPAFEDLYQERYKPEPVYEDERQRRTQQRNASVQRHIRELRKTLNSSETFKTFLLLRPTRVGTTCPALLAYYERTDNRQHRVLTHQWKLQTQEVVNVTLSTRNGLNYDKTKKKCAESLNLSVTVKNVTRDEQSSHVKLRVIHAAILSRKWRLAGKLDFKNKDMVLKGQEELNMVLQAERIEPNDLRGEEVYSSNLVLDPTQIESKDDIKMQPYCRFVTLSPTIEETDFSQKESTRGSVESVLVLRWKAEIKHPNGDIRSIIGQTTKWIPGGTPSLILCRTIAPDILKHDFVNCRLAIVPLDLHIVNCSDLDLDAELDSNEKGCVGAWVGRRVHISARDALCVRVSVCVTRPCSYPSAPARVIVAAPCKTVVAPTATICVAAAV